MWSSPKFLAQCEELKRAGYVPDAVPGSRLARGFADLGYEEFLLLPSGRLLSLFTGTLSEPGAERSEHLFAVPSADDLIALIRERGFDIESVLYREQREWCVTIRHYRSDERKETAAPMLAEAFLRAAITVLGHGQAESEARESC